MTLGHHRHFANPQRSLALTNRAPTVRERAWKMATPFHYSAFVHRSLTVAALLLRVRADQPSAPKAKSSITFDGDGALIR